MEDFSSRLMEALKVIKKDRGYPTDTDVTATSTILPTSRKWSDPRDDLNEDSHLWYELMALVDHNEELFNQLAYFRASGSILSRGKNSYIMKPLIDSTGNRGWPNEASYLEMRDKHLKNHAETLRAALLKMHWSCDPR